MSRCWHWDYKAPYYYLVTLKCLPGLPPLSRLDAAYQWGLDASYPLTRALSDAINRFSDDSIGLESVKPFIIMPDHVHLLIKLKDVPEQKSLPMYISYLKGYLRRCYRQETGIQTQLFETEWHDMIVKKKKQLGNFIHYIINNPSQRLLRQSHRERFYCYRGCNHYRLGDLAFDMVGNPELLDEPGLVAVRISRKVMEGTAEWEKTMAFFEKWRPGITAVGTWWSKGEQAAKQKILEKGGFVIHLDPQGFGARWHPAGDSAQRLCAEGRVLYLSPYVAQTVKLPLGTARERCLALNELALQMEAALAPSPRAS